ncbi:MAG: glycosyltransferase family 1 protein [Candidatus Accumulibacter meliphilus]|jgi:glycosyltransferase involved in cell wall biosynthesis|uniref:Glycosyltransferase family 1 protein n=1 Tax=Candidatus Accumulibacter meliphilus TaxID=2211374 RepID=A0A369XP80_9PROT|nr:MAG: glycosyltransferase family 1 protein [Candidatus Accumulibacter meliphilus]
MRRVYIVLSAAGVGGAEKRFTDIWYSLVSQGLDVHLVINTQTYQGLLQQKEYSERLIRRRELHVKDLGDNSFSKFCRSTYDFFESQPRHAIVHYPLAYTPGIQLRFGHRLVVSWVNSAMPQFTRTNWRGGVGAWAGFLAAERVDVLNPDNLRRMRQMPWMKGKVSLTPGGTHVDARQYRPLAKDLDFVFLGRTEPEKQSRRFVEALPEVHRILQREGAKGYRFVVCGGGSEFGAINALARSSAFQAVPFEYGYSSSPESVLGRASVFFSLQRTSNYPSKALAEAMACGAFPVLTAVGESTMMIDGCRHHHFVPRDFSPNDIAQSLLGYLALNSTERNSVSREIAEFAATRFAAGLQVSYFADIYAEMGRR